MRAFSIRQRGRALFASRGEASDIKTPMTRCNDSSDGRPCSRSHRSTVVESALIRTASFRRESPIPRGACRSQAAKLLGGSQGK